MDVVVLWTRGYVNKRLTTVAETTATDEIPSATSWTFKYHKRI